MMVLIYHCVNNLLPQTENKFISLIKLGTNQFWSGVDLFFVISGFLISSILLNEKGNSFFLHNFYLKRIFRIFPIYYLIVFSFFLITHYTLPIGDFLLTNDIIPHYSFLIYLQNFFMAESQSFGAHYLGVSWSLALEEQFYLLWPLLILFINWKNLPIAILVLVSICLFFRFNWDGYAKILLLVSRMDGLLIGSTIAWIAVFKPNFIKKISLVYLILSAGALIGCYYLTVNFFFKDFMGINIFPVSVIYGVLLLICLNEKEFLIKRILRIKQLEFISKISYGIYLYHMIVLGFTFYFIGNKSPQLMEYSDFFLVTLSLVLTCLIAHFSFKFIELPLQNFARTKCK